MNNSFDYIPHEVYADIEKLQQYMLYGSRSIATRAARDGFDPSVMIGAQIFPGTDYDFAAPDTPENHEILTMAGFNYWSEVQLNYKDSLTSAVYIKKYNPKYDPNKIQWVNLNEVPVVNVVLKKDFPLFRQVWNSIEPEFYYKHLWKRSPTYDGQELGLTKDTIRGILDQMFKTAEYMI